MSVSLGFCVVPGKQSLLRRSDVVNTHAFRSPIVKSGWVGFTCGRYDVRVMTVGVIVAIFPLVASQRGCLNVISVQRAELCFYVRGSCFLKNRSSLLVL